MRNIIICSLIIFLVAFLLANQAEGSKIRTCHSCKGINCQRASLNNNTQQCLDSLDYCVTVFNDFNVMQKGCYLELSEALRKRCDRNTVECHKCNTDRCNNLGQKQYSCLQCDSSKDSSCANNPSNIKASRCSTPITPNSYCYVKYEDNTTKRGCAATLNEQKLCFEDSNCLLCLAGDMENCNNVDFTRTTRSILIQKIQI